MKVKSRSSEPVSQSARHPRTHPGSKRKGGKVNPGTNNPEVIQSTKKVKSPRCPSRKFNGGGKAVSQPYSKPVEAVTNPHANDRGRHLLLRQPIRKKRKRETSISCSASGDYHAQAKTASRLQHPLCNIYSPPLEAIPPASRTDFHLSSLI